MILLRKANFPNSHRITSISLAAVALVVTIFFLSFWATSIGNSVATIPVDLLEIALARAVSPHEFRISISIFRCSNRHSTTLMKWSPPLLAALCSAVSPELVLRAFTSTSARNNK
ncbi:hypothetical protein BU23DRAFT_282105 [Bimuria novae-zelandiae CBS 107.79]|uniref:Uncharacterized protein n=1 Tax=Bimuria novae-zelandiae CBS 107.79 TaxID=1447943 RepID=A0A6A5USQ1_9PLEO|nr:hypothetical protein BU23DRAFT_282105 [Bimuria novae-zelandiae CBS 107.79]